MQLFYAPEAVAIDPAGTFLLNAEETHHAQHVLRLKAGALLDLTDGMGTLLQARLQSFTPKGAQLEVVDRTLHPKPAFELHLAVSPTRNSDRLEWLVEKSVELGIASFTPLLCNRTTKTHLRSDRLMRLAVAALKQSLRTWLPQIHPASSFDAFVKSASTRQKCIAYVDARNPVHFFDTLTPQESATLLIGPEGDFTPEELGQAFDAGFTQVSLGPTRLRTETAALAGVLAFQLRNQIATSWS